MLQMAKLHAVWPPTNSDLLLQFCNYGDRNFLWRFNKEERLFKRWVSQSRTTMFACNPKVHCRVQNSSPLNPIHSIMLRLKVHDSMKSSKWSVSYTFLKINSLYQFLINLIQIMLIFYHKVFMFFRNTSWRPINIAVLNFWSCKPGRHFDPRVFPNDRIV